MSDVSQETWKQYKKAIKVPEALRESETATALATYDAAVDTGVPGAYEVYCQTHSKICDRYFEAIEAIREELSIPKGAQPPDPRLTSPEYTRIYQTTLAMLDRGVFPTPTVLNRELGVKRRRPNSLNGTSCQARADALRDAGYTKKDWHSRWEAPQS